MTWAENWPKIAISSWHSPFKLLKKESLSSSSSSSVSSSSSSVSSSLYGRLYCKAIICHKKTLDLKYWLALLLGARVTLQSDTRFNIHVKNKLTKANKCLHKISINRLKAVGSGYRAGHCRSRSPCWRLEPPRMSKIEAGKERSSERRPFFETTKSMAT